jgi:GntR family transcriptional repressor for pyruvate dehydrogenase complex
VRHQIRQPRIAEIIADELRGRILSGALPDGSLVPKHEELLAEFGVSSPSIREALRILETEGLIAVNRGNVGGAIVHEPKADAAAFGLAMVLERRGVTLDKVIEAIARLEPVCAAACAELPDRATTVVPVLSQSIKESEAALDDPEAFARCARAFHERLVAVCGNEPLILVVGAVEKIWSTQFADAAVDRSHVVLTNRKQREKALDRHRKILAAIIDGDELEAERIVREHFSNRPRDPRIGHNAVVRARRVTTNGRLSSRSPKD